VAFTICRTGDIDCPGGPHIIAKVAKSGYTPVKGDLVILDATVANGVDLIADNEAPYGEVWAYNSSTGVISVLEYTPGTYRELPYTGSAPTLGHKMAGVATSSTHGTTLDRSLVDDDNVNGAGAVVAVDGDAPHGTGHCVVRY
jgi:hypothetical protein